jgi:cytochrome c556
VHNLVKHIVKNIGISLFLLISILITTQAHSEQSAEDIIKNRKALFSKNYKALLEMFPDNTKEGFKTEVTSLVWEEKDKFNSLMEKSSNDMIELASVIEETDNVRGVLGQLMWGNCKACHSKYRVEH